MNLNKLIFFVIYGLTFLVTANIFPVSAKELHIAVAANFTKPIERLKQLFEEDSEHTLTISLGSTGQLYAQIENGAPYEVFLAADMKRPQNLIQAGLAVSDSLFTYAIGRLVLWSSLADLVDQEGTVLNTTKFKHLALANPKTAPYGAAAQQVLENKGLLENLQGKIVQGNNVIQTYQFIATSTAELGFIALSQYQDTEATLRGSHWVVDQTLHEPIRQGAVLLKKGKDNPAAVAFITFLQSPKVQKLLEEFGYIVP